MFSVRVTPPRNLLIPGDHQHRAKLQTCIKSFPSRGPSPVDNTIFKPGRAQFRRVDTKRHENHRAWRRTHMLNQKRRRRRNKRFHKNTHVQNPGLATGPSAMVVSISKMTPAAPPCMTPL